MLFKSGLHVGKMTALSDAIMRPRHRSLKKFIPKVRLYIERERFIIKTAENDDDLTKVLRLRHDVFYCELLEKHRMFGMDIDKFDFNCDHLIVIDKKSGTFVGTYRLISSLYANKYYSETEFDISNILALPGTKLELGRACVHRDFRTGSTIALLWRGITEYMKVTGAKYMFGCSSVNSTDKQEIAAICQSLSHGYFAPQEYHVSPKGLFRIKEFDFLRKNITEEDERAVIDRIPTLIKSYLNMGALICGEPAYDKKFKCADFFTLFNLDMSSDKMHKKYKI